LLVTRKTSVVKEKTNNVKFYTTSVPKVSVSLYVLDDILADDCRIYPYTSTSNQKGEET